MKYIVFWFRRDLRVEDNHGLFQALSGKNKVLPIFIFDKEILDKLEDKDPRLEFIISRLESINEILKKQKSSIYILHDKPINAFKKIITQFKIEKVICNNDYEPYAIKRDLQIKRFLEENEIEFESFKDQVIFEKSEIVKNDQSPYVVYTPYSNKWIANFNPTMLESFNSEQLLDNLIPQSFEFTSIEKLGFHQSSIKTTSPVYTESLIDNYGQYRNFPALNATSKLGIYLRFGVFSIREIIKKANKSSDITFLKELIWREFFMQILWHFPHTTDASFKSKYDKIVWRNNPSEFDRWCKGETGYPIIDAGMRELNTTGFLHNRVRMLVAGFLCKHLLIDWRWGERYFAKKLLDYELSSNVGNWQWASGSGVDAAPYFRIFNPIEQTKKFDSTLEYTRKWVPEFEEFNYAEKIVDHKFARKRCLSTYKRYL
ncbi:MAG: deoxyribodipyrimidine photo-lyase [Crocinitomicaceae bacterium]|nr:deoxyribodipyrimidine photo-lyase [Crocinitomicaceae bacterium]